MAKQNEEEITRLQVWQAAMLRATAFPIRPVEVATETWWAELVGQPPETHTSRPREGMSLAEGTLNGEKLFLRVQPDRLDLRLMPLEEEEPSSKVVATIGALPEVIEKFLPLALRWFKLSSWPDIQRLAFGATLLQPVEDRKAGYQTLAQYLPAVTIDAAGSSEFLYQINRPRDSAIGISGLEINRLSKWFVVSVVRKQLAIGPASVVPFEGPEHHVSRLVLDINTAPELERELPREKLSELFEELVELGKEIAVKGDLA